MNITKRYVECYNKIAKDDLKKRIDKLSDLRYKLFIKFIGRPEGKILDVGGGRWDFFGEMESE
jgi:hypothetical protein